MSFQVCCPKSLRLSSSIVLLEQTGIRSGAQPGAEMEKKGDDLLTWRLR